MPMSRWIRAALALQTLTIPVELLAAAFVRAPYSFLDSTMSDLAALTCTDISYPDGPVAVCSPLGLALSASWMVAGLLLLVAAVGLWRPLRERRRRLGTAAGIGLVISGLGTLGSGAVPLDVDLTLHALVSLPAIVVFGFTMSLTAAALGRVTPVPWVVLGVVASVSGILVAAMIGTEVVGILERVSLWVPTLWFGLLGITPRLAVPSDTAAGSG